MQTMTSKETAEYIGVSIGTLRKYVHEGGLPVFRLRVNTKWIFAKELVDEWLVKQSLNDFPSEEDGKEASYGKLRVLTP